MLFTLDAKKKYPNNTDSPGYFTTKLDKAFQQRLRELLDSTKDVTVTYGINGKSKLQKAKEELNLGLDL